MSIKASSLLMTSFGPFQVTYHKIAWKGYISLVEGVMEGSLLGRDPVVRLQSACLFAGAFHSSDCDCQRQIDVAMQTIKDNGRGVIVYSCEQEGKGVGLANKIRAMHVEYETGVCSEEAFKMLNLRDERNYRAEIRVLKELGVPKKIHLLTDNPRKQDALRKAGFLLT